VTAPIKPVDEVNGEVGQHGRLAHSEGTSKRSERSFPQYTFDDFFSLFIVSLKETGGGGRTRVDFESARKRVTSSGWNSNLRHSRTGWSLPFLTQPLIV